MNQKNNDRCVSFLLGFGFVMFIIGIALMVYGFCGMMAMATGAN